MSTISSREKTMLLVAVVAVLYAFAGLSYKKQAANWKVAKRVYLAAQEKVQDERALIDARDDWSARYEQMRDLMPVFPYEQDVDTYWLNIMDQTASRNGLTIARRQAIGKGEEIGDVFELPIDCKGWEGSLESLVKFLHDLQKEGAMLDVRQLFIQPVSGKPGILKGTFILTCAFMRGETVKAEAPPLADQKLPPPEEQEPGTSNAPPASVQPDTLLSTQLIDSAESPQPTL